jgi:hypothetical protein
MNYPKPDILEHKVKAEVKYLFVPQYNKEFISDIAFINHLAHGGDVWGGIDEFEDAGPELATELPITLEITNLAAEPKLASLYHSFKNRLSANQGNPSGIIIGNKNDIGVTYDDTLLQSEHQHRSITLIIIKVIYKPHHISFENFYKDLKLTHIFYNTSISPPHTTATQIRTTLPPWQHNPEVIDVANVPDHISINGFCGFDITLPQNSKIEIEFYPVARLFQRITTAQRERREARRDARAAKREARRAARGFSTFDNDSFASWAEDPSNEPQPDDGNE